MPLYICDLFNRRNAFYCNAFFTSLADGSPSQVAAQAIQLYKTAADYAATRGIIIADTKFEFGLDENGTLGMSICFLLMCDTVFSSSQISSL